MAPSCDRSAAAAAEAFAADKAARIAALDGDDPVDEHGAPVMTSRVVAKIARETGGYIRPEVNERLWLQNRRWRAIGGLEKFTGVRMLHLENNQIGPCVGPGLRHLAELRAVYLNCNMLREVDNLSANEQLTLLNLATNQISAFAPDSLPRSLNTLECANNILERADALAPLALLPNLEVLNLQNNRLADERLFRLFSSFPALRVLYLQGNPIQRAENYRRRLVSGCVHLTYLDDCPVETLEKRGAEAWAAGGAEAERAARQKFHDDKRAAARAQTRRIAAERAARRAAASLNADASGRRVLSPEAMDALPSAALDDAWAEALGEKECSVCVRPLRDGDAGERALALKACGHVFHLGCLRPWLTTASATCPVCRAEVLPPEGTGPGGGGARSAGAGARAPAPVIPDAAVAAARAVVGGSEEYAAWMTDGADARRREKDDAGGRANDETAADAVAGDEEEAGDGAGAGAGAGDGARRRARTEGQKQTERTIQLQLRRRFSELSCGRAEAEAVQHYNNLMFDKLKERRAKEAAERSAKEGDAVAAPAEGATAAERVAYAAKLAGVRPARSGERSPSGEGKARPSKPRTRRDASVKFRATRAAKCDTKLIV